MKQNFSNSINIVYKYITVPVTLPYDRKRCQVMFLRVVFQPQAHRAFTPELEMPAAHAGTVGIRHHLVTVPLLSCLTTLSEMAEAKLLSFAVRKD